MTRLALKIAAIVASGFVGCVWFALSFGLTPLLALATYTFLWVAVGNYLKTRSRPAPEPTDDIAIAELVGSQAREIRELQQSNHELREQISEFVPHSSHFASQSRCHDGQGLFQFELTYVRTVVFRHWPHAQQAIRQFRNDTILHRDAQHTIDRAHGRRTIA